MTTPNTITIDAVRYVREDAVPALTPNGHRAVEAWTAAQTEYWALIREACA